MFVVYGLNNHSAIAYTCVQGLRFYKDIACKVYTEYDSAMSNMYVLNIQLITFD